MKKSLISRTLALACLGAVLATHQAMAAVAAPAESATRSEGAPATWDLSALYASPEAWEASRVRMAATLPELQQLQGTLGTSAASLLAALTKISTAHREVDRLDTYANLKGDENTRIEANTARRQLADLLDDQFNQATSFVAPELVSIGAAKIDAFIAAEPGLAPHAYFLHRALRQAAHTLPRNEEALLAGAADPLAQSTVIFETLSNADMPWPKIQLRGKTVTLDAETYVTLRQDRDPKVREQVFKAFWSTYKSFERTLGTTYVAHLKAVAFDARAHKFETSLQRALSNHQTPEAVYRTLVAEANASLPTLHRYLRLRSKLLGLKQAKYSDMYAALVKPPRSYTLGEAERLTLQAVAPLGEAYVKALGQHFQEGWMDAVPRPGKRSGAYMNPAAYDVHPFVLMSFNNDYESASTIAHEWGHAMHSVLANSAQPYEMADYALFVAEIPSTTNEMLLADYVSAQAKTKAEKIDALAQELELLRGTFFRQAMFAEFELKTHQAIEKGEALTGEGLTKIYLDLLRRYQGDAQGVMKVEDLYGVEWAYIPHFYSDFYVYQYATSISAAAYFAEGIEKGDTALRTRYLDMLKAGGSNDPYLIVKAAGPELATPAPYRALVKRMDRLIDELAALTGDSALE